MGPELAELGGLVVGGAGVVLVEVILEFHFY